MSASALHDIRAALAVQLATIQTDGLPPIAWENDSYNPTLEVVFLEEQLLPISKEQVGQGHDAKDQYDGIYQVTVIGGSGQVRYRFEVGTQAAAVEDLFTRGDEFTYNGKTVKIMRTEIGVGYLSQDGAWYRLPVEIYYKALI